MIGTFFSGLSKVAKIIFISGFVLAVLICLVIFSYLRNDGSTNKYDQKSVEAVVQGQVESERIAVQNKATVDATEEMRHRFELEKLKLERGTLDVNKQMELEHEKDLKAIEIEQKKAQAAAAAKTAAINAKRAKEQQDLQILKSLAAD